MLRSLNGTEFGRWAYPRVLLTVAADTILSKREEERGEASASTLDCVYTVLHIDEQEELGGRERGSPRKLERNGNLSGDSLKLKQRYAREENGGARRTFVGGLRFSGERRAVPTCDTEESVGEN